MRRLIRYLSRNEERTVFPVHTIQTIPNVTECALKIMRNGNLSKMKVLKNRSIAGTAGTATSAMKTLSTASRRKKRFQENMLADLINVNFTVASVLTFSIPKRHISLGIKNRIRIKILCLTFKEQTK